MRKIEISQRELATILDVSVRWIQRLEVQKVFKKLPNKKYNLQPCITAYVVFLRGVKSKTLAEAQRVHLEAKTRKLRIEGDRLQGILVLKSDLSKEKEELVRACEENFKFFPYRVVPILTLIPKREDEQELMVHILRHEISECWRDLAGIPKKETPVVFPGDMILVCLGLITGDKNGEVVLERCSPPFKQRMKVSDILEKYGSGIDALRNPTLGGEGGEKSE